MNTQFYAPDRQATSPQGASRTERRTATIRPVMPEAPRTRIGVGVDARKLWAAGRPVPSSPPWWPWSGS